MHGPGRPAQTHVQWHGLDCGVNAIYELHEADPDVRIIVLTTFDGDEDIYRAIRAGAKAYLLKDVKREVLFQCIREVLEAWPAQRKESRWATVTH